MVSVLGIRGFEWRVDAVKLNNQNFDRNRNLRFL